MADSIKKQYNTVILGAGAAGMICAAYAGGDCLVVDHAKAAGEKIRISGGGRCNFTNIYASAENYISENPHFVKSALARYTQWDFIALVEQHKIAFHEKTLGQLFCDTSARDIVKMLLDEMEKAGAQLSLQTEINAVTHESGHFDLELTKAGRTYKVRAKNLVLATGGKSIPKMGATGLAYDIAEQFGLSITPTRAGLVPLTFTNGQFTELAGIAMPCRAKAGLITFDENMLFTHRGLSGPAILQISSYWKEGDEIVISLNGTSELFDKLRAQRALSGRQKLSTILSQHFPARFISFWAKTHDLNANLADYSDADLRQLCDGLANWQLRPSGSEGYRTAEVTIGGVSTNELDSKSLGAKAMRGLYVIGEAVDVTGWLGGYNFQWAWSSGVAAGRDICAELQKH